MGHSEDRTSACSRTVAVAFSCLSGVTIFTQDAFHEDPDVGAHILSNRPINRSIPANCAQYQAAVAKQPANPPLSCTVSNGSGTVGQANVTSVLVTCVAISVSLVQTAVAMQGHNSRVLLEMAEQVRFELSLPFSWQDLSAVFAPLARLFLETGVREPNPRYS